MRFLLLTAVVGALAYSVAGEDFSYDDKLIWGVLFEGCSGDNQSPIDIVTEDVVEVDAPPLSFSLAYSKKIRGKLSNNDGKRVQWTPNSKEGLTVTGGPLGTAEYKFSQLHWHIGAEGVEEGSEHKVDGLGCAGEFHLAHYNGKFESPDEARASDEPDALLAIGMCIIIEGNISDSKAIQETTRAARHLRQKEDLLETVDLDFAIMDWVANSLREVDGSCKMWSYLGSRTTPPCKEHVRWIILDTPIVVGSLFADALRSVPVEKNNFRAPTQDIGKRIVEVYDPRPRRIG